jgi:hypothetical protein
MRRTEPHALCTCLDTTSSYSSSSIIPVFSKGDHVFPAKPRGGYRHIAAVPTGLNDIRGRSQGGGYFMVAVVPNTTVGLY